MDDRTLLKEGAAHFKLHLTEAQLTAFEIYRRELLDWNQRMNLTRIVEPREIVIKHFLDSLSVAAALAENPGPPSMIDVGSGAGFPGLPLKIALPEIRLTLLEATGKKVAFLRHIAQTLDLTDVTVVHARAEEAGQMMAHRQRYQVAVARAVAALPVLAEYTLPFVAVGGIVVAQKGVQPVDEIQAGANALGVMGGKLLRVQRVMVPGLPDERHLLLLKKIRPTPKQYPRRPGLPAQKPI
jgi:16S rRNA (guanine527-N7)-methyltransferase